MTTPVQQEREHHEELLALLLLSVRRLTRDWGRLTTAQDALLRTLERIRPGIGSTTRIRTATNEFNRQVAQFERDARAFAERWAATDLPTVYRDGALQAIRRANRDITLFRWTVNHQAALTPITATFYVDLMRRIQEAVRRAQAFARTAQDAAREVAQGRNHAGIDSPRLAADHPLSTVIYSDQSRHPVESWAHSALTWQAVSATNAGAVNTAQWELDAQWMQVVDGPECVMPGGHFLPHGNLKQMVRSWFSGPAYLIKARTPSGTNLLTVGPNHPVLTKRGWVRAHLLREGDELVYDRLVEDPATRAELHLEQMPVVEDVYASLVKTFPLSVRPATRNDLHRDGEFCQGEIDVVNATGGLLVETDPTTPQQISKRDLVWADGRSLAVIGGRHAVLALRGDGDSSDAVVCSPGTFFPGLGPGVRMPQGKRLAPAAADTHVVDGLVDLAHGEAEDFRNLRRLASLFEVEASYLLTREAYGSSPGAGVPAKPSFASPHGVEGNSTMLAGGSDACASGGLRGSSVGFGQRIGLSEVESITVQHYEGWVYDATTSGGTFSIDGLIVSNCGFVSHQDTDHADGTIRSIDDASMYPAAHPGCIRSWIPRPDLNGHTGIESGDPA